jgi:ceramide glucosyltransferase
MLAALWYGAEASLAAALDWPLSLRSPLLWVARDLMLPWLWLSALCGDGFAWRGNEMNVRRARGAAGELQLAEE